MVLLRKLVRSALGKPGAASITMTNAIYNTAPRDGTVIGAAINGVGTAPLLYSRQWLRCNATGAACTAISGEITATYRLGGADIGKTLRIELTATNAFGATKAQSAPSPLLPSTPATPSSRSSLARSTTT